LGILLKGPIAAVLVGAVLGAHWRFKMWSKRVVLDDIPRTVVRGLAGGALVAAIAAPWFIWANAHTDGRLWDVFFVYHNLERGFSSETLAAHPWWFYLARIWIDAFPWSLALPWAGVLAWRRGWWRDDPACRVGLIWFVTILVLLSALRFKRADYLLPAFPGLALFLGAVGTRWWKERPRRWAITSFVGILGVYAAGWNGYLRGQQDDWPYRDAAEAIRARAGADTPIIFFRAEVHPLAFHLRRPLGTIREWENLDIWAREPRPVYFVMPAECARAWPGHRIGGRLTEAFTLRAFFPEQRERDLVVLHNEPGAPSGAAYSTSVAGAIAVQSKWPAGNSFQPVTHRTR
jgi:hypothetical protein